jgi:hypothetical protein
MNLFTHQVQVTDTVISSITFTDSRDKHQTALTNGSVTILRNDQLEALFLNVFILCLYMFRAASAHHQEVQIVLIHHLV